MQDLEGEIDSLKAASDTLSAIISILKFLTLVIVRLAIHFVFN